MTAENSIASATSPGRPFPKGVSGNPGGRPKVITELRDLARRHSHVALETLVSVCTDKKQSGAARVAAANALLDRGYGKPTQLLETSDHEKRAKEMTDAELEDIIAANRPRSLWRREHQPNTLPTGS